MKILLISDQYPPNSPGGASRVVFELSRGLAKADQEVVVLTVVNERSEAGERMENKVRVIRIFLPEYKERWRSWRSLYNLSTVRKVKKIIKEFKPQVVHAHNIHYYLSYASLKVAGRAGAKVFLTAHDVMLFHYGKLFEFINKNDLKKTDGFNYKVSVPRQIKRFRFWYNPLRNIIIRHYLKYVDKIFAVSQELRKALNDNKINNVEVMYNATEVKEWQVESEKVKKFKQKFGLENKKVIMFGGRLSALKGSRELLEAMNKLAKKLPNLILLLVAKEDEKVFEFKKRTIGFSVKATGWLGKQDLKIIYNAVDLLVTPSICLDTFNLMNLEAMAAAKPVVTTCFGGAREVVEDGVTGFVVNPFDTNLLKDRLFELLTNDDKAIKFGEAGYKRAVENFALNKWVEKHLNYYRDK